MINLLDEGQLAQRRRSTRHQHDLASFCFLEGRGHGLGLGRRLLVEGDREFVAELGGSASLLFTAALCQREPSSEPWKPMRQIAQIASTWANLLCEVPCTWARVRGTRSQA